jgi:hypothetical protein
MWEFDKKAGKSSLKNNENRIKMLDFTCGIFYYK